VSDRYQIQGGSVRNEETISNVQVTPITMNSFAFIMSLEQAMRIYSTAPDDTTGIWKELLDVTSTCLV
jgi:hypothetical protein